MEFRLQARYNPNKYPHLHQWWSNIPKGKGSYLLCELLEAILIENLDKHVFAVPPTTEEVLETIEYTIDQSVERVSSDMFNGFLEALDGYMQRITQQDFRGEWEKEQQKGLLGGVEEW